MGRNLSFLLICALGVVLRNELALAYPTPVDFDGSILRWDINLGAPPITYGIVADRDDDALTYQGAVDDAAGLWNDVPSSYFNFAAAESSVAPQVTIHLKSAIDGGDYSAGYALFDEYEGKKPTHCSIFVTADDTIGYTGMAKTFLHEMGHCLGLGHSLVPQAIMSYKLTENHFALDVDDQAAAARLYPVDGSKPKLPPGCSVGATQRGANPWAVLALMILPPLAVNFHARSRRRTSATNPTRSRRCPLL